MTSLSIGEPIKSRSAWTVFPSICTAHYGMTLSQCKEPLEEFEDVGRLDADGRSSITLYWHLLSQADQVLLNSIADSQTDY
jgi:hypothetical protein